VLKLGEYRLKGKRPEFANCMRKKEKEKEKKILCKIEGFHM
jgi:hypothetical protein